jgi:hypothetical protein
MNWIYYGFEFIFNFDYVAMIIWFNDYSDAKLKGDMGLFKKIGFFVGAIFAIIFSFVEFFLYLIVFIFYLGLHTA